MDAIREDRSTRLDRAERRVKANVDTAKDLARSFLDHWPEESGKSLSRLIDDIRDGRANRAAWRKRLQQLEFHDIKSLEAKIAQRDRTTIFAALLKVRGSQQDYHTEILALQNGINEVLSQTIYDQSKRSYARLEIQRKMNPVISEFHSLLKDCATDLTDLTTDEVYRRGERLRRLDRMRGHQAAPGARRQGSRPAPVVHDPHGRVPPPGGAGREGQDRGGPEHPVRVDHRFGRRGRTPQLVLHGSRHQPRLQHLRLKHCTDDTAQGAMTFLKRLGLQLVMASPIKKVSAFEGFADRFYNA